MKRKEFIKICGILGIGFPLQTSMIGCSDDNIIAGDFSGKVVIIGAGAGGLSAGYLLQKQGVEFEILEASSVHGGRMRIDTDFADFPIPLGAEWIHTDVGIFQRIVDDSSLDVNVSTKNYSNSDTYGFWDNGQLEVGDLADDDIKFVGSSWFNFFEEYIVPSIAAKINYQTVVKSIDYTSEKIIIETNNGQYTADKVIVAVPLKILQDNDINFMPVLPQVKLNAINNSLIWDGFKAFIEFSEKFYLTQTEVKVSPATDGQKLFYDAAYGQDSPKNILGLFAVGKPAKDYSDKSGEELRDFILNELDEIFDGQASPNYVKHIVQNWNDEPYIKAGYLSDHADSDTVAKLSESINDKVYFAGGAYTTGEDWVAVQTAAQSAKEAVKELIK